MSLEVTVFKARDLPKVQRLGIQDPFVEAKYAGTRRRTPVHNNGGQNPVFNTRLIFAYVPGESVVRITIVNDRGDGEFIAAAKVDFAPALQSGLLETRVPVADAHGRPHGEIEIAIRCPQFRAPSAPEVPPPTEALAAMAVKDKTISYQQALSDERAKYYAEVASAMVPHNAVAGAMAEGFVASIKEVGDDDEKEMESILKGTKTKVEALVDDARKEWTNLGLEFRKGVAEKIIENDSSAKERMAGQLERLSENMKKNGMRALGEFEAMNTELLEGIDALLKKYKLSLSATLEGYDMGFKQVLGTYKDDVEDMLKAEAEKKSLAEAAKYGSPPPEDRSVGVAPVAAAAAAAAPAPPSAPAAAPPLVYTGQPTQYAPLPAAAAPPPSYHAAPAAPGHYGHAPAAAAATAGVAVGAAAASSKSELEKAQAEKAKAEADLARQQAYYAQVQMQQAQYQAEMQRQEAAKREAAMKAAIVVHHHRKVVRRAAVGGLMLGAMLD